MKAIAEDPESYLATAAEMLTAEGLNEAAQILRVATPNVEETCYDNWNGGTTIWTFQLLIDAASYAALGAKRELIEQISGSLLFPTRSSSSLMTAFASSDLQE